jgi:3-oxoacyl-[acyl-carrier-protein] synthase II
MLAQDESTIGVVSAEPSARRVYVTGVGVVSSIGLGKAAYFRALSEGTSGISPVESFDVSNLARRFAGEVKAFEPKDHLDATELRHAGRCAAMTLAAARMAIADAGLTPDQLKGPRTAVVLGTTMGEGNILLDLDRGWIARGERGVKRSLLPRYGATLLPILVARAIGSRGMVLCLPAACASGNYAIGLAADLIRAGRADVVVTGASEILQQVCFWGFVRLGAMAHTRCQPFDRNREGLILGEGSGLMVLESEEHAVRRGATPQAEVGGYGISCDAFHITRPHPDATGNIAAMRDAIAFSGVEASDVDFVSAHGTGTRGGDLAEVRVIHEIFGSRRVPVSSIKGMLGHSIGASSALGAVACVMTIQTGVYPPTIAYETPDHECDVDVVANVARRGKADIILNNALAFGGYNAVTCFARPGVLPPPRFARETRPHGR